MPVNDELGKRMKEFYEQIPKTKLMKRMPVIIRIDGKAFHTFTRGFKRPFDKVLIKTMQETTKYLCENIQGCVLGYTQSDEITLVLVDYQKLNSDAWFGYEVQKMCSIASSMATMAFNKFFTMNVDEWGENNLPNYSEGGTNEPVAEELMRLCDCYWKSIEKGAMCLEDGGACAGWWLMNTNADGDAAVVDATGKVCTDGYNVSKSSIGVRPAIWVTID